MAQRQRTVFIRLGASSERVFAALADHEGWARWVGMPVKVIAGPPDGGTGTVRRLRVGPFIVDEEITYFDPPRRLVYRAVAGMPADYYQGEVLVEPCLEGCQVTWTVAAGTSIPGLAQVLVRLVEHGLRRALPRLSAQLSAAVADK